MEEKNYIFSITVYDRPGVLNRISMIFSRRMINIHTINADYIEFKSGEMTRIVVTFKTNHKMAQTLLKLIRKLVDVVEVDGFDTSSDLIFQRELALIRLKLSGNDVDKVLNTVRNFKLTPHILDLSVEGSLMTVEVAGLPEEIEGLIDELGPDVVFQAVRSGIAAIPKLREIDKD
ncbi:MAG: acetolactate synthase small subunit [Nitrososphaeria archaeon]|nr:acetolactate synthase small subunit [Nitrososphaeria archaeon]NIQ32286.1 acetolactate synthase small subunit [Nitrososphaeria archaeon]